MRRPFALALAGALGAFALTLLARAEPAALLPRLLGESRYVFCHDENRPVKDSLVYCDYASAHVPACPAFAAACARARRAEDERRAPWTEPDENDGNAGFRLHLGPEAALVSRVLFWASLVAAMAWWLFTVGKHLFDGRSVDSPDDEPTSKLPVVTPDDSTREARVVDRDALLLLARSRKAVANGDLRGAARFAHAALVRALEAAGHLHVDRSSTNGDYERALHHSPELRGTFRKVAAEVERSEFGQAPPDPAKLEQILSWVEPVVRGVLTLAVFSVALCLSACGTSGPAERPEDAPGGDSIFRALAEQSGASLTRRTRSVQELAEESTDTVVVLPSAPLSETDWKTLIDWVKLGNALFVAGPRSDLPAELGVKDPERVRCVDAPSTAPMGPGFEASKVVFHGAPMALGPEWIAKVTCGGAPIIAVRPVGEGRVVLLADARFLSNASLAAGEHARLLFALLLPASEISQIDRRVAAGTDSPYRAVAQSGLLPALVQGLFLMLLVALARGASFGVRREPSLPPRRAFAEHVVAVGRLYERAGASRHALGAYAAWALDRLSARVGRAGGNRVLDSAAFLARTTGLEERAITRVLADAADARQRPGLESSLEEDRATFAALDELVKNTGGMK